MTTTPISLDRPPFRVFRGGVALVTGGAGFIGSHLGEHLLRLGASVRVLDDLSGGRRENVPSGAEFIHGSILDSGALARASEGVSWVFHEAALVSVPQSVEQPDRCLEINVTGTHRVLEAARKGGVKRVVFAASAAAYGNTPRLPSREDHLPECWSPYAMSKVAGEMLLATFSRCFGLSTVSLRYFNVFGARQDPKSAYAAAISAFADAIIAGRSPKVFGDGLQTRDFVPVENIVLANLLAASSERPLAGEVLNIGTGSSVTLLEVIEAMGRAEGARVAPEFFPPRAGDVRDSRPDISRARELLGYEAVVGFEEGIRRTLQWARRAEKR